MADLVGVCRRCGTEVYCRGGFLEGIVAEGGGVICLNCAEREPNEGSEAEDEGSA
ncbi:hypothetical protein [Paenibacillus thalictri]|uniref:hypothetical protein n=1 Tax=Paenibacillus thalictri TaxID=2527873 RepID=UPI0013EF3D39|nr:hypothetical protein [Paenibacillus thalictri]